MSCSINGYAERLDAPNKRDQLPLLGRVQACGRLIKEQQPRVGRKRARPLDPPLVAVGKIACQPILVPIDSYEPQPLSRLGDDVTLLPSLSRRMSDRGEQTRRRPAVAARHDVLEDGHFAKQANVRATPRWVILYGGNDESFRLSNTILPLVGS